MFGLYNSDPSYDFKAALDSSLARARRTAALEEKSQAKAENLYMESFMSGESWRETNYGLGFPTKTRRPEALRTRPRDVLAHHVTKAPQGRRTTPQLVAGVSDLTSQGFAVAVIADTLNLKDGRVRQLQKLSRQAA